jgi:hypothetical protein
MTVLKSALHAYLPRVAHDTWHDTAAEHGVTVSGLLAVLADQLDVALTPEVVAQARAYDVEQRGRRRRRARPVTRSS